MPGFSTIVAKAGWKFFGLGNLLLIFLDETKLLPLSLSKTSRLASEFLLRGAEWSCQCHNFVCPHADESPYR
jgi:hypothetical protein